VGRAAGGRAARAAGGSRGRTVGEPATEVVILDRQKAARGISRLVKETAEACLREEGREGSALSVLLTDQEGIRAYNERYRGKRGPTDVLSFPHDGPDEEGRPYLGDIVISVEQAREQAPEYGNSLSEELRALTVHGILHLLGMDHETDSGEMRAREDEIRARILGSSGR